MSEQNNNTVPLPDQLSDILLVLDKPRMRIEAVTGVDKDGELKTVDAKKKNQGEFMRVDKQGDLFSNFFSNFLSQLKNPMRFGFFKVPADKAVEVAQSLQKQVDSPTKEGEKLMAEHEVQQKPVTDNKKR